MALWHVLILCCFGMAVGGALVPPRIANAGIGGYTLGTIVGIVVGFACAWMMWIMHWKFGAWIRRHSGSTSRTEWYFRALYFSKVLWMFFTGFLGFQFSRALERLVL